MQSKLNNSQKGKEQCYYSCPSSKSYHIDCENCYFYFQAYIFDLRAGTYCSKLGGHNDTVSDVAFHPLYPQVGLQSLKGNDLLTKRG